MLCAHQPSALVLDPLYSRRARADDEAMAVALHHLGRLLVAAPFSLVLLVAAVRLFRESRHADGGAKIGMTLVALVLAAIGVGIAIMIVTDDDFTWCIGDKKDVPRCRQL